MIDFWNERYGADEFAYGTLPNTFLKEQLASLTPGEILFPAEGEGRNAVFAAKKGFNVSAFDMSTAGQAKAKQLAASQKVEIDYKIARLQDFNFGESQFDLIAFIYVHMGPDIRKLVHQKAIKSLKKGGKIILEAFNPMQLGNESGGPKNKDWLFSKQQMINDFDGLHFQVLEEKQIHLAEGPFHNGMANVIRVVAVKL
ncbi:MAG: class I SAM-dependent methyltransferase [Bacteroidia bacterium]